MTFQGSSCWSCWQRCQELQSISFLCSFVKECLSRTHDSSITSCVLLHKCHWSVLCQVTSILQWSVWTGLYLSCCSAQHWHCSVMWEWCCLVWLGTMLSSLNVSGSRHCCQRGCIVEHTIPIANCQLPYQQSLICGYVTVLAIPARNSKQTSPSLHTFLRHTGATTCHLNNELMSMCCTQKEKGCPFLYGSCWVQYHYSYCITLQVPLQSANIRILCWITVWVCQSVITH